MREMPPVQSPLERAMAVTEPFATVAVAVGVVVHVPPTVTTGAAV